MDQFAEIASFCGSLTELNRRYFEMSRSATEITTQQIILALQRFQEIVRYLNTRRSQGAILKLESEADVQDAVYLMLRPWVCDLAPESPTEKIGNRFSIKDFISTEARTIVEAKYVRDVNHGKRISAELHDDIEMYRHHQYCDNVVFFIYDPESYIPDHAALKRDIEGPRMYGEKAVHCHLIVKP